MADNTVAPSRLQPPFERRAIPPYSQSQPVSHTSQTSLSSAIPGQQHVVDSPVPNLLSPLESLPTITDDRDNQKRRRMLLANDHIHVFLQHELNLERLHRIHGHLWMAGRPMRAHPLHRYKMQGFEILCTQQMDLHLLKFSNRLMVKPLTEWMLSHDFWTEHLCDPKREEWHKVACGFLLSYVWLLVTPLDLKLAHEMHLLPSFVTWPWWKVFVADFLGHIDGDALDQVDKRFHFGELRLGRVNSVYRVRYWRTHFIRGYLYGYNRYAVFFQRNFGWALVLFAFFSVVLSAMEVGAGLELLASNGPFLNACYGFVIFSIVIVAFILAFVGVMFTIVFFLNMRLTLKHRDKVSKVRKDIAEERKSGNEKV